MLLYRLNSTGIQLNNANKRRNSKSKKGVTPVFGVTPFLKFRILPDGVTPFLTVYQAKK